MGRATFGSALLFVALLSKESAVAIPVLLIGTCWVRGGRSMGQRRIAAVGVALCGYLVLRASVGFPLPDASLPSLRGAGRVAVHYLALLGLPRPLSVGRTLPELAIQLQSVLLAGVVCAGLAWTVRRGGRLAAVALGFGVLALLLVGLGRLNEAAEVAGANSEDPSGRTQLVRAFLAERAERTDDVDAIANEYLARGVPREAFDVMLATLRQSAPNAP